MSATTGLAGLLNRGGDWLADLHRRAVAGVNAGGEALPLPGGPAAAPAPAPPVAPVEAPPLPVEAPPAPAAQGAPPPQPHQGADLSQQQRLENAIWENEQQQAAQNAIINDADATSSQRDAARVRLGSLTSANTALLGQLGTELQRQQSAKDKATADAEAKAEKERTAGQQPKNGDTRTQRVTHNGVSATITEKYQNGQWSYVPNSAVPETGLLGQRDPQETARTGIDLDTARLNLRVAQQKFDDATSPEAKERERLNLRTAQLAVEQAERTLTRPTSTTVDNTLVLTDPQTGKVIERVDLLTPEGRARADRLAELGVQVAEENLRPKFGTAQAQYAAEAQRRQQMATQELSRLSKLQQEGQLSPDQAEAQFDAWMRSNVEAPLAGYKAAAEQERREQEQANLTRQTAEDARVEALNRQREQLAYAAGEEGRTQGIELGRRTRAPEYITGLGGLAESMATGTTFGGFGPGAFDPANYKKALPNIDAMADAAVNRLLARVSPSVSRQMNVPLAGFPQGADLSGMMNRVRYSGPLSAAPQAEAPVPGQEAQDLGTGMARTQYPGGRFLDWRLPG